MHLGFPARFLRRRRPSIHLTITALILAIVSAAPVKAQEREYDLLVYGLGASLDGSVGAGPIDAEVSVGFDDILDNLETGGMVGFRTRKDRWAVMLDAIFVGLGAGNQRVDIDVDELLFEVAAAYQLSEVVEVVFGARFVDIDTEIDLLDTTIESGESWVDPLIGLRLEALLRDKWLFIGRADIGGFGVGSDFAFNVVLSLGYRFGESSTLVFGWRAIDFDFEDGEGLDRFEYDVLTNGPMIGVAFHF